MITTALLTLARKYRCTKHIGTDENLHGAALQPCKPHSMRPTLYLIRHGLRAANEHTQRRLTYTGRAPATQVSKAGNRPRVHPRPRPGLALGRPASAQAPGARQGARASAMWHGRRQKAAPQTTHMGPACQTISVRLNTSSLSCSWQQQRRARQRSPVTVQMGPAEWPAGVDWGRRETCRMSGPLIYTTALTMLV